MAKSHLDDRVVIKDLAGVAITLNEAVGMIVKEAKLKDEPRKKLEDLLKITDKSSG